MFWKKKKEEKPECEIEGCKEQGIYVPVFTSLGAMRAWVFGYYLCDKHLEMLNNYESKQRRKEVEQRITKGVGKLKKRDDCFYKLTGWDKDR
jgi:hypothetical protein